MPKIDQASAPQLNGTSYPAPYDEPCLSRMRTRLAAAAGIEKFGVNILRLPPGAWSSQRHWHSHEDEFVYVLEGEVVLVEEGVETVLRAGDCAAFRADVPNAHHVVNRSEREAKLLEVGNARDAHDVATYPDCDLLALPGRYVHKDGTPYPETKRVFKLHGWGGKIG
jgi:uncharacterized cupin superfamily protein